MGECLVWGVPGPGVPGPGGGAWSRGVPGLGVCLVWGMPGPGGCAWSRVCAWLVGVVVVSQHALRQTPCEQNDTQVQKYYLAPNFVCGR